MKVFVAGAGGAMGAQLLPRLRSEGHEITGMTRSATKADAIAAAGATPVIADALDPDQVAAAVAKSEPEAIIHELTALSGATDLRHFDRNFAPTNRLRTEGTDHLLSAGRAVGVERFLAQSFAGWPFARSGALVKSEEDPLDPTPPSAMTETMGAIRRLEEAVTGAEWTTGVVLRYGGFYGPGTSLAPDGEYTEMIRERKFPIVGDGAGLWSFIQIEDAADATVAALRHAKRGVYNIVDDEPAPVRDWLPVFARGLGAKPPRHVPRWLGRLLGGEATVVMMTEVRGASNAKAKRELGWSPAHRSWREGLPGLAA
jgi:nucleoside-diphosphate-sugar epimerase